MPKPTLLDTFCCEGGAAIGYHRAGFDVTGIDIKYYGPRYPFKFIRGDAIEYIKAHGHEYDLIHASPPCQLYSRAQTIQNMSHPNLIKETRQAILSTSIPYIIENVEDARSDLHKPLMLCGAMFPPLHTYRHRLFETSFPVIPPPHPRHIHNTVKMGRPVNASDWYYAIGNFPNSKYVRKDLDFPHMTRDGLRESIPWQYTYWLGAQCLPTL